MTTTDLERLSSRDPFPFGILKKLENLLKKYQHNDSASSLPDEAEHASASKASSIKNNCVIPDNDSDEEESSGIEESSGTQKVLVCILLKLCSLKHCLGARLLLSLM